MQRNALLVTAVAFLTLAGAAGAQTADDLVARNLAARGGKERILAVRSARLSGTITMGPVRDTPMTLEWRRPSHVRLEFKAQGLTGIQAYDGTTAWALLPFHGMTAPEVLPDEQSQPLIDMADFDGALVDYQAKGNTVELLGKEKIEGTDAYKLKLTKKNGRVSMLYLDAESALLIKQVDTVDMGAGPQELETTVSDYKAFGGLLFACSRDQRPKGATSPGRTTTFEKVELDVDLPDSRFAMPKE